LLFDFDLYLDHDVLLLGDEFVHVRNVSRCDPSAPSVPVHLAPVLSIVTTAK